MQLRQEVNIASHVVDYIECSRNNFPLTQMKEGVPPEIWKVISASKYFVISVVVVILLDKETQV